MKGKKLSFIEIGHEINTLALKHMMLIQKIVVMMKDELEKEKEALTYYRNSLNFIILRQQKCALSFIFLFNCSVCFVQAGGSK